MSSCARRPPFSIPFEDAPVAKPRMIRPQSLDALAGQTPDEARLDVEQLAGRPLERHGIIAPGVDELSRHRRGRGAILRPTRAPACDNSAATVHRDRRGNSIGGEAGAFLDGVRVLFLGADKIRRAGFRRLFPPFLIFGRNRRNWRNSRLFWRNRRRNGYATAVRIGHEVAARDAAKKDEHVGPHSSAPSKMRGVTT